MLVSSEEGCRSVSSLVQRFGDTLLLMVCSVIIAVRIIHLSRWAPIAPESAGGHIQHNLQSYNYTRHWFPNLVTVSVIISVSLRSRQASSTIQSTITLAAMRARMTSNVRKRQRRKDRATRRWRHRPSIYRSLKHYALSLHCIPQRVIFALMPLLAWLQT